MKIQKIAFIALIGMVSCVSLASCGVKSKTFTNTSDSNSKIVGRDDNTASLTIIIMMVQTHSQLVEHGSKVEAM